ncbi:hypothetical protein SADUNF_Sadunf03G0017300 [Salix dunnii]|uniref:H(+)-exporting diphosphatase n=1 Tax=Salix dunnii TaxID=1413687 RepID=A0A835K6I7_9ROSI|nr:hypothetical protein SADUNF_Sadunf03G0017300 [Salix dunnii]
MKIATFENTRTTLEARKRVGKAFITAFRSETVMGSLLTANGILVLGIAINLFKLYYRNDWEGLSESLFSHARLRIGASFGMLSTIAIGLAIDSYGDEMTSMSHLMCMPWM